MHVEPLVNHACWIPVVFYTGACEWSKNACWCTRLCCDIHLWVWAQGLSPFWVRTIVRQTILCPNYILHVHMMAYIIQFGPKTGLAAVNVTVAWLVDFNYQPEISLSEIWLEVELWTIPLLIKSNFRIKICYELSKNSNHRYRTYS